MSIDKLVDSTQLDSDLTSVANAIRAKSGGSGQLAFPSGFVSEIGNIPSGGGGSDETIETTIINNSSGDVTFDVVLTACENMGYTLTYDDCILRFRAEGANAISSSPTNYTFNNHTLVIKDGTIWNASYNRCTYKSGVQAPDAFNAKELYETNNTFANSGDLIDSSGKIVNTYEERFHGIGGSGTTVRLYEIPVDWSEFLSTL